VSEPTAAISLIPQSRRERPAKSALTRDGIIEVALRILDTEGLGKVTMRRIASELDTGPASLYVYVRNTEDLYSQLLDALLGRIPPVSTRGGWRARLHALLAGYAGVLFEHFEIARATVATHPIGEHYFALVEQILELLHEGGASDAASAWGVDLLLSAMTANAIEHGTLAEGAVDSVDEMGDLSLIATWITTASPERYPRIVALGKDMLSGIPPERFRWSLDALINGILATPR
jgi:AcrR family transcriptional regulator